MRTTGSQNGYVLVSLVWVLASLGLAVSAMALFSVNSLSVLATTSERVALGAMVQGGLEVAVWSVGQTPPNEPAAGRAELPLRGGLVRVSWRGEGGKLNINSAPTSLFVSLLRHLGVSERDATAYGASLAAAQAAVRTWSAGQTQDAPIAFQHVSELTRLGIPAAIVARASPYLTVYGNRPQIDPRLAPRELLASLPGMTDLRLRSLMELRKSASTDRGAWSEQAGETASFLTLAPSPAIRVRADARLENGLSLVTEIVIVSFADDSEPYRILSWEELPDARDPSGLAGDAL